MTRPTPTTSGAHEAFFESIPIRQRERATDIRDQIVLDIDEPVERLVVGEEFLLELARSSSFISPSR